jgi:anthranilate phosphoribosyltransferase
MNAAAALLAGNRASDLNVGARLAEEAIDSGEAKEKMEDLIKLSQSL